MRARRNPPLGLLPGFCFVMNIWGSDTLLLHSCRLPFALAAVCSGTMSCDSRTIHSCCERGGFCGDLPVLSYLCRRYGTRGGEPVPRRHSGGLYISSRERVCARPSGLSIILPFPFFCLFFRMVWMYVQQEKVRWWSSPCCAANVVYYRLFTVRLTFFLGILMIVMFIPMVKLKWGRSSIPRVCG